MEVFGDVRGAGRLPANLQLLRLARQAINRHMYTLRNSRPGERAYSAIFKDYYNISLTIGEIYKMVEDFSIQFSPLYLPM